jgi:hypothetical protein
MRRLLVRTLPLALWLAVTLAPAAQATNDGRGFYGATNDKVVTDAGFILILFFPIFIFLTSARKRARRQPRRSSATPSCAAAGSRSGADGRRPLRAQRRRRGCHDRPPASP